MKKIALLLFVLVLALSAHAQSTYTWNVSGVGDYQVAASWTPSRATPATNDILVIDGAITGGAVELNNIPTQTIGKLLITNNAYAALRPVTTGGPQLTLSGGSQALLVNAGSTLKITSSVASNYLILAIDASSTGEIYGDVILKSDMGTSPNRIIALQASGLFFKNGSTCALAPVTTGAGNGFGGTSGTALPASVNNAVIFEPGSHFYQGGEKNGYFNGGTGSNPFGATAPNSYVVFQSGSSYTSWSSIPATSGRTYANFIWCEYIADRSLGGGSPLTMLNNCILRKSPGGINPAYTYVQGTMGMSSQTGAWSIGGDLIIENGGGSLVYNPAPAGPIAWTISGNVDIQNPAQFTAPTNANVTVVHDGSTSKTVNWAGKTLPNMTVNAAGGISLAANVTISGNLTLTAGTITTNGNAITATNVVRPTDGGYVIGALTRTIDAAVTGNRLFPIGTNPYSPVEVDITAAGTGAGTIAAAVAAGDHPNAADPAATLDRFWTLTPAGISGATATLVFHYLDGDVTGTLVEANMVAASWNGATWTTYPTVIDTVNNTATVTGVTSFSDWTLIGASSGVKDWKMF